MEAFNYNQILLIKKWSCPSYKFKWNPETYHIINKKIAWNNPFDRIYTAFLLCSFNFAHSQCLWMLGRVNKPEQKLLVHMSAMPPPEKNAVNLYHYILPATPSHSTADWTTNLLMFWHFGILDEISSRFICRSVYQYYIKSMDWFHYGIWKLYRLCQYLLF